MQTQREYLFRGKRYDGIWEEGYLVVDDIGAHWIFPKNQPIPGDFNFVMVNPETVGQFTGLLDKNGTKIFEGDIVRSNWGYYGIVEFEEIMYAKHECVISDDIEIIGNKWDNPELLEEANDA